LHGAAEGSGSSAGGSSSSSVVSRSDDSSSDDHDDAASAAVQRQTAGADPGSRSGTASPAAPLSVRQEAWYQKNFGRERMPTDRFSAWEQGQPKRRGVGRPRKTAAAGTVPESDVPPGLLNADKGRLAELRQPALDAFGGPGMEPPPEGGCGLGACLHELNGTAAAFRAAAAGRLSAGSASAAGAAAGGSGVLFHGSAPRRETLGSKTGASLSSLDDLVRDSPPYPAWLGVTSRQNLLCRLLVHPASQLHAQTAEDRRLNLTETVRTARSLASFLTADVHGAVAACQRGGTSVGPDHQAALPPRRAPGAALRPVRRAVVVTPSFREMCFERAVRSGPLGPAVNAAAEAVAALGEDESMRQVAAAAAAVAAVAACQPTTAGRATVLAHALALLSPEGFSRRGADVFPAGAVAAARAASHQDAACARRLAEQLCVVLCAALSPGSLWQPALPLSPTLALVKLAGQRTVRAAAKHLDRIGRGGSPGGIIAPAVQALVGSTASTAPPSLETTPELLPAILSASEAVGRDDPWLAWTSRHWHGVNAAAANLLLAAVTDRPRLFADPGGDLGPADPGVADLVVAAHAVARRRHRGNLRLITRDYVAAASLRFDDLAALASALREVGGTVHADGGAGFTRWWRSTPFGRLRPYFATVDVIHGPIADRLSPRDAWGIPVVEDRRAARERQFGLGTNAGTHARGVRQSQDRAVQSVLAAASLRALCAGGGAVPPSPAPGPLEAERQPPSFPSSSSSAAAGPAAGPAADTGGSDSEDEAEVVLDSDDEEANRLCGLGRSQSVARPSDIEPGPSHAALLRQSSKDSRMSLGTDAGDDPLSDDDSAEEAEAQGSGGPAVCGICLGDVSEERAVRRCAGPCHGRFHLACVLHTRRLVLRGLHHAGRSAIVEADPLAQASDVDISLERCRRAVRAWWPHGEAPAEASSSSSAAAAPAPSDWPASPIKPPLPNFTSLEDEARALRSCLAAGWAACAVGLRPTELPDPPAARAGLHQRLVIESGPAGFERPRVTTVASAGSAAGGVAPNVALFHCHGCRGGVRECGLCGEPGIAWRHVFPCTRSCGRFFHHSCLQDAASFGAHLPVFASGAGAHFSKTGFRRFDCPLHRDAGGGTLPCDETPSTTACLLCPGFLRRLPAPLPARGDGGMDAEARAMTEPVAEHTVCANAQGHAMAGLTPRGLVGLRALTKLARDAVRGCAFREATLAGSAMLDEHIRLTNGNKHSAELAWHSLPPESVQAMMFSEVERRPAAGAWDLRTVAEAEAAPPGVPRAAFDRLLASAQASVTATGPGRHVLLDWWLLAAAALAATYGRTPPRSQTGKFNQDLPQAWDMATAAPCAMGTGQLSELRGGAKAAMALIRQERGPGLDLKSWPPEAAAAATNALSLEACSGLVLPRADAVLLARAVTDAMASDEGMARWVTAKPAPKPATKPGKRPGSRARPLVPGGTGGARQDAPERAGTVGVLPPSLAPAQPSLAGLAPAVGGGVAGADWPGPASSPAPLVLNGVHGESLLRDSTTIIAHALVVGAAAPTLLDCFNHDAAFAAAVGRLSWASGRDRGHPTERTAIAIIAGLPAAADMQEREFVINSSAQACMTFGAVLVLEVPTSDARYHSDGLERKFSGGQNSLRVEVIALASTSALLLAGDSCVVDGMSDALRSSMASAPTMLASDVYTRVLAAVPRPSGGAGQGAVAVLPYGAPAANLRWLHELGWATVAGFRRPEQEQAVIDELLEHA